MKTILVIDDNNEIRENTAEILDMAGYRTVTAENGKMGVTQALKEKPDLIVCDIMMPDLDGYGVLHLLKKNPETENIPFIYLTAKTERADLRKGMELGADDYIMKPFDDLELLRAIEIRLKKMAIVRGPYEGGEKGANELMRELKGSGIIKLDVENYDSEQYSKKTFRIHEDGKEYITNLYSDGDFVGYIALLENSVYEESAEILEDSVIVSINKEDFLDAIYNDMTIAGKFIKLITHNVRDKEDRLLHLAYDSLRKRVAKALVEIAAKFSKPGTDIQQIDISREDIAQYVGTATESLIRTLSDFKSEKLIEIRDGKIRIINMEKLKNLLY
jgi:CheY-like chemotaxis protein